MSKKRIIPNFISMFSTPVIVALSLLPFLTFNSIEIYNSIVEGVAPLSILYYPRIFSGSNTWHEIGDFFSGTAERVNSAEFIMLGDILQRVFYKLLGENIILTYKLFSLVYLIFWVYFLSRIISSDNKKKFSTSNWVIGTLLLITFNTNSLINEGYGFYRLINPQFAILIWIIFIYVLTQYFTNENSTTRKVHSLSILCVLIFISSITYLFTFLALIGASVVFLMLLILKNKRSDALFFLKYSIVAITPLAINIVLKYNEHSYVQVLNRQGLIESRFPGALKTLVLCGLILLFLYFVTSFSKSTRNNRPFNTTMFICTTGVAFASQSNVVTNKAVQFYHFELFALILLLILISRSILAAISKIKFLRYFNFNKRNILTFGIILLTLLNFYNVRLDHANPIKQFFKTNFTSQENLIVDISGFEYSIPVYTHSRILYQGDIPAYRFSDEEIMKRYFINSGCDINSDFLNIPALFVYQATPLLQKEAQVLKYSQLLNLENQFRSVHESYAAEAKVINKSINSSIANFKQKNFNFNCVDLAKKFEINAIIFDNKSNWKNLLNSYEIFEAKLNKQVIFFARI